MFTHLAHDHIRIIGTHPRSLECLYKRIRAIQQERFLLHTQHCEAQKTMRPIHAAELMGVDILDDDLEFNTLTRVVWDKTPIIEAHDPSVVSLANHSNQYPGVFALHVGDTDEWFHKLIDDYGNDSTAYEIEITTIDGDILVEDVQYAIPDENGNKAYSAILLTTRRILHEGRDFRYVRELTDERTEDDYPEDDGPSADWSDPDE